MLVVDKELFKKMTGTDIWEFRTLHRGISYRLLAFWDTDGETLVVATHGFAKKTQRTPRKEIDKAERIREEYFIFYNKETEVIWKKSETWKSTPMKRCWIGS